MINGVEKDFKVQFNPDETMVGATLELGDHWAKSYGTW